MNKIIFWISTAIMCLIFCYSAGMYITNFEMITGYFPNLGFPSWLVAPLAALKILGMIAILSRKSQVIKEWAYAGFFFDAVLAFTAHYFASDGAGTIAAVAIVATVVSRVFEGRYFGSKTA